MDILKILEVKYSDRKWSLNGDSYNGLTMLDGLPKPTEAELQSLWKEVQAVELRAEIVNAVQLHMDTTAQTRNYDNIHTLSSYADSLDIVFAAEGLAGRRWRDEVWITCRQILTDVQQGLRPMPTVNEVLAELPVIEW